jgi:hypothetical protein
MVLVDSDVLVWVYRGHPRAAALLYQVAEPAISIITRMELLRGARNAVEKRRVREVVAGIPLRVISLSPAIGERAYHLLDEVGLANAIDVPDCLIAATALEHNIPLVTANLKHYRVIRGLQLQAFVE